MFILPFPDLEFDYRSGGSDLFLEHDFYCLVSDVYCASPVYCLVRFILTLSRILNVTGAGYADCNGLYTLSNLTSIWDSKARINHVKFLKR
jgi:hypothetical protein